MNEELHKELLDFMLEQKSGGIRTSAFLIGLLLRLIINGAVSEKQVGEILEGLK
jgi:hypothetical protein